MKKLLLILFTSLFVQFSIAQDSVVVTPTNPDPTPRRPKLDIRRGSADHLMIQLGYLSWSGKGDSINTKGLPRTFNLHLLFDFPFKSNPHLSFAIGLGIGTDHMYFDDTRIDIKGSTLRFLTDTFTQYKKYKLTTGYLEVPLELRYASKPENMSKSFKIAIGAKVGTMVDAHTKANIERDPNGFANYVLKEKTRTNFNTTRLAATFRVGYGVLSLFGTYQFNEFIKEGRGPDVRPFTIGLSLSGL